MLIQAVQHRFDSCSLVISLEIGSMSPPTLFKIVLDILGLFNSI